MSNILKNKKIIISAGASGIGWATAKVCLSKGATVFISDIEKKFLNKVKKNPLNNKRLFSYECDASNENDVKNYVLDKYYLNKTCSINSNSYNYYKIKF